MDKASENEEQWRAMLTHGMGHGKQAQRLLYGALPSSPRCKLCHAPFQGWGGAVMNLVGYRPAMGNPTICNWCDKWAVKHPGSAEVELSLLFADVRGSTGLAQALGDQQFTRLINRFFVTATEVLIPHNAMLSRLVGDEVLALFLPMLLHERHPGAAVAAAQDLLRATGHGESEGPWLPLGIGVHSGMAHVGVFGAPGGVHDFTALGDEVNLAARLAQQAAAGEILLTESTRRLAGVESIGLETRHLELKGRSAPIDVWVLHPPFLPP